MNLNYDYSVPAHRIQPDSNKSANLHNMNLLGTQRIEQKGLSPMMGPGSLQTKTAQNFNP